MSAKMKGNLLEKVLGCTSAVLLRLRDDRRCLKYKERREVKRGKREAVKVGWDVICSQSSCADGRVEREGESRGEKREARRNDKGKMRSRRVADGRSDAVVSAPIRA
jgi:hypothetical protein